MGSTFPPEHNYPCRVVASFQKNISLALMLGDLRTNLYLFPGITDCELIANCSLTKTKPPLNLPPSFIYTISWLLEGITHANPRATTFSLMWRYSMAFFNETFLLFLDKPLVWMSNQPFIFNQNFWTNTSLLATVLLHLIED